MRALLDIFSLILLYALLSDTEISVKYSDATNAFLVGGMDFNCVSKGFSKNNPVFFSGRNQSGDVKVNRYLLRCIYSPPQISIRFRFLFSCPC